jgi:hypothetical protein
MFKAGAKRICITPGTNAEEVDSYRNPPPPGVYQDVFAKALALEDGKGGRLSIVSIDIIDLPGDMLARIRTAIKRMVGLDENRLLLCVSHTHSGPTRKDCLQPFGLTVSEYRQLVVDRVSRCVDGAFAGLEPATVSLGNDKLSIAINRRWRNPTGYPVWRGNPYGEVDPELSVLKVENRERRVKAVLMNYACHASAIGTPLIGNDYPGFAEEIIENRYPGSVALFAQGCSAEIKPYNVDAANKFMYGVPPAVAAGLGWEMAKATARIIERMPNESVAGEIRAVKRVVHLQMKGPPSAEEAKRVKGADRKIAARWRKCMLGKIREGKVRTVQTSRPWEIQMISIGDRFRLVALQGEPCVRIGLRIKEQVTANEAENGRDAANVRSVMVFGYTNNADPFPDNTGDEVINYIPSRDIVAAGGYEAESYLYNNWAGPYRPEVEDVIVKTILSMQVENG